MRMNPTKEEESLFPALIKMWREQAQTEWWIALRLDTTPIETLKEWEKAAQAKQTGV